MRTYRRRLPHRDVAGVPVFVTWCLHRSLPAERVFHREHLSSGEAFAAWDGLLAAARAGPKYLAQPALAEMVAQRILQAGQSGLCAVDSFVVMPKHVHVLWVPAGSLAALVRTVNGSTARDANRILGATGQRFWQEEYFDRTVRTSDEAARVRTYIEMNPVKAGLCAAPGLYAWSSANPEWAGLKPRAD
ncbi:MAG TPA: transposase [Bryobacteraceae bacterium]|nr:transposase [Bryobacteraceae bacterium]